MGINLNGLRFLLYAKAQGVDYKKTAMLGRQGLHLTFQQFERVFNKEFGYSLSESQLQDIFGSHYADKLLSFLGAETVDSFDASDYEGSTQIHDFNLEIDPSYFQKYSCVIDGGSLEHIFNFPTAVKNCMNLLQQDGFFLGITPTNNYPGHGFYQFSPELFYQIFSETNGFETLDIFVHEEREAAYWYRVKNAMKTGGRVIFSNKKETLMLVFAQRKQIQPVLQRYPNQADYLVSWGEAAQRPKVGSRWDGVKRYIPVELKKRLKKKWQTGLRAPQFTPFYPYLNQQNNANG